MGIEKVTTVAVALAERKMVFLETIGQISNLEEDVGSAGFRISWEMKICDRKGLIRKTLIHNVPDLHV